MDLTRLSVREGSISLWSYCYSCRMPGPVDGRMKFHLVIFLAVALLRRFSESMDCFQDLQTCAGGFKGRLVCAYLDGCFLEMEYCGMVQHNCARLIQRRHLFLVQYQGKCKDNLHPMCSSVDF